MVFLRIYKTEITELKEENTCEETSKIHVAQTEIMKQMSPSIFSPSSQASVPSHPFAASNSFWFLLPYPSDPGYN